MHFYGACFLSLFRFLFFLFLLFWKVLAIDSLAKINRCHRCSSPRHVKNSLMLFQNFCFVEASGREIITHSEPSCKTFHLRGFILWNNRLIHIFKNPSQSTILRRDKSSVSYRLFINSFKRFCLFSYSAQALCNLLRKNTDLQSDLCLDSVPLLY